MSRQQHRLDELWDFDDNHVILQATWHVYQEIIAAYEHPKTKEGKRLIQHVMNSIRKDLPAGLEELA